MLNDLKIKQLKSKDKLYRVADHSGLCIEIRPTGAKFWRYRYRFLGKAKMLTIGQYPEISLAYARSKTMEYREQLAKDVDPINFQKNEKQALIQAHDDTFAAVAKEFCDMKKLTQSEDWLKRRTSYFKKDVYPAIGNKPIKFVDSADIKNILDATIRRIIKSGRGTGEVKTIFVRQIIGEVMQYAIITKRITHDPTYALRRYIIKPDVEHAKPVEPVDKKIIMLSISRYGGTESTKNALKAIIYTMLRTIEIRRGLKEYIDFDNKTWTIPVASKAELQAGKRTIKKNRTHIVPLPNQAIEIIKTQFELYPDSKYIFPGDDGLSMMGKTTLNSAFKNMDLGHITMHDFRATASTDLNEENFNADWIELQLSHVKGDKTRASYDHAKWLNDRAKMLQTWADMVDEWADLNIDSFSLNSSSFNLGPTNCDSNILMKNKLTIDSLNYSDILNIVQSENSLFDFNEIMPIPDQLLFEMDDISKYSAYYYLTDDFKNPLKNDDLMLLIKHNILDYEVDIYKGISKDLRQYELRVMEKLNKIEDKGDFFSLGERIINNIKTFDSANYIDWIPKFWGVASNPINVKIVDNEVFFDTYENAPHNIIKELSKKFKLDTIFKSYSESEDNENWSISIYRSGDLMLERLCELDDKKNIKQELFEGN